MIRREGNDPMHYTISRRGKKLNNSEKGSKLNYSLKSDESLIGEVVIFWFFLFLKFFLIKI